MEVDSPKEPRQSEQDYRHIAEQIFFHVLLHGGEGNPFRQIANKWFIDLAAPKLKELLGAPKEPTAPTPILDALAHREEAPHTVHPSNVADCAERAGVKLAQPAATEPKGAVNHDLS